MSALLPTAADLSPVERERWAEAQDRERLLAARVVISYLLGGWMGWHRFAAADQLGGVLRALAASIALLGAFGLEIAEIGPPLVPIAAVAALWATDAAFLPGLLREHRRRAERRFFVQTWRVRRDAGRRHPGGAEVVW